MKNAFRKWLCRRFNLIGAETTYKAKALSIGTKMALRLARIAAKLPGNKVKLVAGCVYGLLSLYGMGGAYELIRPLIDQKRLEAVLDKKVSEVNSNLGETKNA